MNFPESPISTSPSERLFEPRSGNLHACLAAPPSAPIDATVITGIQNDISQLLGAKNYPCVPALQSFAKDDYLVGAYHSFGRGRAAPNLARDLAFFIDRQKKSGSLYMSFWAVFPDAAGEDVKSCPNTSAVANLDAISNSDPEEQFEQDLWHELSCASAQEPEAAWDPQFSQDPDSKQFCFSFRGEALFVVGLHPGSSRVARRFPYPVLIFNLYEQFRVLMRQGRYEAIVRTNRHRDVAYQGSVNPMAEKYGDTWEAIQFSGRENSEAWRCPFHHGARAKDGAS